MGYLVLPILLLIYLELFGRALNSILAIDNNTHNIVIGFVGLLCISYIAFFIPIYLKTNFICVFIVFLIIIALSCYLIIKTKVILKYRINLKIVLPIILLTIVLVVFSAYYYIGDINFYDTLSYTNLVAGNIYEPSLNSFDFENGFPTTLNGYSYQSFYMLASCFEYITNGICRLLNINFFYFTQFVWLYSIIYYALFSELFISLVYERKCRKKSSLFLLVIIIFIFVGNWNIYNPFIGNYFRIVLYSYVIYYCKKFGDTKETKYFHLLLLFLLAGVTTAACNAPIMLVFMFALMCCVKLDAYNYKYFCVFSIIPLLNTFIVISNNKIILLLCVVVPLILLLLKKQILKYFKITKAHIWLPIVILMSLTIIQYVITGKALSLNKYFISINDSGTAWDFFDYSTSLRAFTNVVIWLITIFTLINYRKEVWAKSLLFVLVIIFSPFTIGIVEKYFIVYQRFMELIVTPFLLFIFVDWLCVYISKKNKVINTIVLSVVFAVAIMITYNEVFNNKFMDLGKTKKPEGYDFFLKMTKDEADMLSFSRDYIVTNDLKNSFVISNVFQLRSEVPTVKTLYNRTRTYKGNDNNKRILFEMLFPGDSYYGEFFDSDRYDYSTLLDRLKKADVKLLIQGKDKIYHNKETDEYYPLYYEINKQTNPIYENNSFIMYDLSK